MNLAQNMTTSNENDLLIIIDEITSLKTINLGEEIIWLKIVCL